MNVGDIVRVTSKTNTPDASMEGTITELIYHKSYVEVTFSTLWDNKITVSLAHFDVTVIRAVEPQEIGSIHKTNTKTYVKFSNTLRYGWIQVDSETMMPYRWSEISNYS